MSRKKALADYANYIRGYLDNMPPKDWKEDLFGDFTKKTNNMIQKYFEYILEQNANKDKVLAIEERNQLGYIKDPTRSIDKFFKNKTVPFEKNLNFIALVFDVPVKKFSDFVKKNNVQGKEQSTNKTEENNKEGSEKVRPYTKKIIIKVIIMSLFISIIGILLYLNSFDKQTDVSENISFFPIDIGTKLYEKKVLLNKDQVITDSILDFHTINIFNNKCLSKDSPWSFEVDKLGEDMNSLYGQPYSEEIKTLFPLLKGRTTIANQLMDIHFNIENKTNTVFYFSNLKIKVLKTYDAVEEESTYNLYEVRNSEVVFNLKLSNKNMYGFTVEKKEINPNEAVFCKIRITGDAKCENLIYKIQIIADFVDIKGKHYEVKSDKNYLIGFVSK